MIFDQPHRQAIAVWVRRGPLPPPSLLFKPTTPELQRPAILRHDPDDVGRHPSRYLGLDIEGDGHLGPNQPGEVGDDLFCYPARITADAGRVELDRTVEAPRLALGSLRPREEAGLRRRPARLSWGSLGRAR